MTQVELEREVAQHTGESVCTIHRRGFSVAQPHYPPPLVVDWDRLEAERHGMARDRKDSAR